MGPPYLSVDSINLQNSVESGNATPAWMKLIHSHSTPLAQQRRHDCQEENGAEVGQFTSRVWQLSRPYRIFIGDITQVIPTWTRLSLPLVPAKSM